MKETNTDHFSCCQIQTALSASSEKCAKCNFERQKENGLSQGGRKARKHLTYALRRKVIPTPINENYQESAETGRVLDGLCHLSNASASVRKRMVAIPNGDKMGDNQGVDYRFYWEGCALDAFQSLVQTATTQTTVIALRKVYRNSLSTVPGQRSLCHLLPAECELHTATRVHLPQKVYKSARSTVQ